MILGVVGYDGNVLEYKDYISREGEDNELYYDIKIKASRILAENTDNTFVTPVFNGSADLRSAAGEMIEIVTKSVRRGKDADEKFVDGVFEEVKNLYRLDSIVPGESLPSKTVFGPLPTGAVVLIACLAASWTLMIVYVAVSAKRRK